MTHFHGNKDEKKKFESGICTNYVPVKAGAQAGGFGFQKSQARPKAASGQTPGPGLAWLFLAWLGLAWGFRPGPAHH